MISVSEIILKVQSNLDAEGSDRYDFERDYKPAINYASDFFVSVFNSAFGQKKLSEENLRELIRIQTFQTSKYSRIDLNSIPEESVWTVLLVSPEPLLDPDIEPVLNPDPTKSLIISDVTFVKSSFSAGRLTTEEWNEGSSNIFMPGNTSLGNPSFTKYAYKNSFATVSDDSNIITNIEVRPFLDEEFCCVTYLKYPKEIELDTDSVEFPKSMTNLLVEKVSNFISHKQGDGTNIYAITEREVSNLVSLMI